MNAFILFLTSIIILSCNDSRNVDYEKRDAAHNRMENGNIDSKMDTLPLVTVAIYGFEYPQFLEKKELNLQISDCELFKDTKGTFCQLVPTITFDLNDSDSHDFEFLDFKIKGFYKTLCLEESDEECLVYEVRGYVDHAEIAENNWFKFEISKEENFEYKIAQLNSNDTFSGTIWKRTDKLSGWGNFRRYYFLADEIENSNYVYINSRTLISNSVDIYGENTVLNLAFPLQIGENMELPKSTHPYKFHKGNYPMKIILKDGEADLSVSTTDINEGNVEIDVKIISDIEVFEE